jgi:hypothetical protein
MVDGLWAGGNRSDTDFAALVYQIKLLGFNSVRLPFTFSDLKRRGRRQAQTCADDARPAWARRASDPEVTPAPDFESAPAPSLEVPLADWERTVCNSYIPKNTTTYSGERLLWTVQYLVASGLYVVVRQRAPQLGGHGPFHSWHGSCEAPQPAARPTAILVPLPCPPPQPPPQLDYHPSPADPLPADPVAFASAWLGTWANVTCLPNFAPDIKGRVLLGLLNEPDAALDGRGVHWER